MILSAVMNCGKSWHAFAVPKVSHHPPPAAWRSARSGEAQRVTVGQLLHLQRRQAGVRPGPHIVLLLFSIILRQAKRICQTASTSVSEQTAVSSTFGVSSHAPNPSRKSSLSCNLLTTAPFSPTRRKPYSTSSTAYLMQPRTSRGVVPTPST